MSLNSCHRCARPFEGKRGKRYCSRRCKVTPCVLCRASLGVLTNVANLTAACASCNARKQGWPLLLFLLRRSLLEEIAGPLRELRWLRGEGGLQIAELDPKSLIPRTRQEKEAVAKPFLRFTNG